MRIKNTLKSLLIILHRHKKSEPDIYIFTLPRGGSTLLTEILNTDPHSKTASESFSLNKDNRQVLRKYFDDEFLAERYVDITEDNLQKIIKYYGDLAEGKHWNSYYWSDFFSPNHRFNTTRTIFKTHKVTYYFDDLMHYFKSDYGLYLLRHPVSHALSRIRKDWTSYIDLYAESEKIRKMLPKEAKLKIEQVNKAGTDLEKFIVSWCLENYVFIRCYQNENLPSNVFPVFYEDLVVNPEKTIMDICDKVKVKYNKRMLNILDVPSSGIVHSTGETGEQIIEGNTDYLVNRWSEEIDNNSMIQFKEILDSFGIKLYSE